MIALLQGMKTKKPINSAALCRRVSLTFDLELVVLGRCLLYWTMLWNFGEGEGLVGSILSYLAGGVPGETGPLGQLIKLRDKPVQVFLY